MMSFLQDIKATLSLAWPMIIGFLAAMGLLLTDGLMIGRLGVDPLAGYTFGSMVVSVFMVAGYGLCAAQHVRGADAYARRDAQAAADTLRAGILVCSVYGAVCGLLFLWAGTLLHWFGQEPQVVDLAVGYTIWVGWAIIPNLVFQNFKNACEAQEHPWVPLFFYLPGLTLNVLLNWVFIYGNWGMPALGVTGAGMATFISKLVMLGSLVFYIQRRQLLLLPEDAWTTLRTSMARVKSFLNIGVPTGLQTLFEHLMFVVVAIWMGWLGANELAAHQIAFRLGSFSFMIPLGLAFALSIRVSSAVSRGDVAGARQSSYNCLKFIALLMLGTGLLLIVLRSPLSWSFFGEPDPRTTAVVTLAMQYLLIVAAMQLFDGVQFVANGALRGLSDVRIPTLLTIGCYWLVAMPIGYLLAFHAGLRGSGLWLGLMLGLFCSFVLLVLRLRRRFALILDN